MNEQIAAVERIGLTGEAAVNFIREQQEIARRERREEREANRQREEANRQREHEIQLRTMKLQTNQFNDGRQRSDNKRGLKLPAFVDGTDEIDSYLQRFERFARANEWEREKWAVALSALLTGRALDTYSRLSEEAASNYDTLREALFKRYNLTEEGYRDRFRKSHPLKDESPEEYIFRLKTNLEKWIELSPVESTYEGLRNLIIRERFIESCSKDLGIYIQERSPESLEEMAKLAQQYLTARGRQFAQVPKYEKNQQNNSATNKSDQGKDISQCSKCNKIGHRSEDCYSKKLNSWRDDKVCFFCHKPGHMQKDCLRKKAKESASCVVTENKTIESTKETDEEENTDVNACCVVNREKILQANMEDSKLFLADGSAVDVIANASNFTKKQNMPVTTGRVNGYTVNTLRDSGCSGIIVKQKFVSEDQFTGKIGYMILVDNTLKQAPFAMINVDTPYLKGYVEALCLKDAVYDLIIGNVQNARRPEDPNLNWKYSELSDVNIKSHIERNDEKTPKTVCNATCAGNAAELNCNHEDDPCEESLQLQCINKSKLIEFQQNDEDVQKCKEKYNSGKSNSAFVEIDKILYRIYKPKNKQELECKQIVMPKVLRGRVLNFAHDSKMSGHLAFKRTYQRLAHHFYWRGMVSDIKRYCNSCDICQRTVEKGKEIYLDIFPQYRSSNSNDAYRFFKMQHPPGHGDNH